MYKFRALKDDMSDCRWVYGNLIYENGYPRIQEDESKLEFTTCLKNTECLFMGFKDGDGNDIYDKDIIHVKWKYGDYETAINLDNAINQHFEPKDLENTRIIGNKVDNPEYLFT